MTVPETVVLPITPYPNGTFGPVSQVQTRAPSASARVITLPETFPRHKSGLSAGPRAPQLLAGHRFARQIRKNPCQPGVAKFTLSKLPTSNNSSPTQLRAEQRSFPNVSCITYWGAGSRAVAGEIVERNNLCHRVVPPPPRPAPVLNRSPSPSWPCC